METYKKGISLIVLVITILVLAILATAVILTLSNTNIIDKARETIVEDRISKINEVKSMWYAENEMQKFNNGEEIDILEYLLNSGAITEEEKKTAEENEGKITIGDKVVQLTNIVKVVSVTVTGSDTVQIGETIQLTANIQPSNATNKTVEWSSSDETKAKVDSTGVVTGISAGEVTITATSVNGITSTYTINVAAINVTGITITGPTQVQKGESIQLTAEVIPANATDKTVTWSSGDTTIATVDETTGEVTGVSSGSVIITATSGGVSATHLVEVPIAIGDLVAYTPTADPKESYDGATYVKDTVTTSETYNTYIESTTKYTPGSMTWVYLGQDEAGNILLTSQEATSFNVTIAGQDGFVTGPDRMDTLCNTLYGNSTYGYARNMKIEDVNRTLGYPGETGNLGSYYPFGPIVKTETPMTIGEIETELGTTITRRTTPRLSETKLEDYLSDSYTYTGTEYKEDITAEYRVIFRKADGTTNQSTFWLSSPAGYWFYNGPIVFFRVRRVDSGGVGAYSVFCSDGTESSDSYALRPVIVLGSNIQFGEKNSSGEWTLVVQ